MSTFIGKLVKSPERINAIIAAVRHRGIDQAGGDMALGFFYAGSIIRTGPATAGLTGGHQVGVLHCRRGSTAGYRVKDPRRSRPGREKSWWVSVELGERNVVGVAKRRWMRHPSGEKGGF